MKRFLAVIFCCLCLAAQAAPLSVEFELRRDRSVDGQKSPTEIEQLTVILADDYLEILQGGDKLVHDFVSRRSYRVSGADVVNRSLFADLGFRVAELRNRLQVRQALEETTDQRKQLLGDATLIEHLFGIDDEVSESGLVKTVGSTTAFRYKDRLLAEFSKKGEKLQADQAKAFVRFLRYHCGGHPDILADVMVRGVLPRESRLAFYNLNEVVAYSLMFKGMKAYSGPRPDFSKIAITPPPEPLSALGEAALKLTPEIVAEAGQNSRQASRAALAQGDALGAALRLFEAMLMDGGDIGADLARDRAAFEAAPNSAALLKALLAGAQDPVSAEKSLASLEMKAGRGSHVVAIFRAGFLIASDREVDTRDMYVRALIANPGIAGAWKDLGDIYYTNYETDVAWACWDIGRHLAPRHPMLSEVNRLEEYLRTNYPGFF